jgi:sulfotransferase
VISYLAGMPRSGSTLLASLLNQNPDVFVSSSSPLCNVLYHSERLWSEQVALEANPNPDGVNTVLRSVIPAFYANRDESLIIDKAFTWGTPENLANLMRFAPNEPKFIVMDRNRSEVCASLERLMSENPAARLSSPDEMLRRCEASFNNLTKAMPHNCVVVHYDELVSDTATVLRRIYAFFGMPDYEHQLTDIRNSSTDDDSVWGVREMHQVRPEIRKLAYV